LPINLLGLKKQKNTLQGVKNIFTPPFKIAIEQDPPFQLTSFAQKHVKVFPMNIQRIFSLQPAVLPDLQPDRTAIVLRSLFIGGVVTCVAMRVTQQLNLRIAASLSGCLFTFCFESWRARRVEQPKPSGFPTDLDGQNALMLTLIDATPEKWVEIWNQFCRLPEPAALLVPGNALLADTMKEVFLGPIKADGESHLLEPFIQGNDQLISYLEKHAYFPMLEAAHAARKRIALAIAQKEPSITRKLLRQPLMSEFNKLPGFKFDCWTNVRDAETAQVLKEAKIDPNEVSAEIKQPPLQQIAQNRLLYSSTEFTACHHASALIEAGATGIVEAIGLCKDRDHLAGWMASYWFYQDIWSLEFTEFHKTMNKGHFVALCDRSRHVDDPTILRQSDLLWDMFCKFNRSSNDEESFFMRLIRLNTDKLPEWLPQAVSQNCPEVVEALLKSGLLDVKTLHPLKKRCCWTSVGDLKTARILQENGLDVNEDKDLLETIASQTNGAAEQLRLVLACGRKKGVVEALDKWEGQAEKAPLLPILHGWLILNPSHERYVHNWNAIPQDVYKEFCLLSEHATIKALWKNYGNYWDLICRFDDTECKLFTRLVEHAVATPKALFIRAEFLATNIGEMFYTAVKSKAPKIVSALLTSGKIQVKDLTHKQQELAWCGLQDAETARILKEQGFRLAEMKQEEVLAMFEHIVEHEKYIELSFKEQFQLLIDQGAQVDEPHGGWDAWAEKVQDE
jgi:hypothetical protein